MWYVNDTSYLSKSITLEIQSTGTPWMQNVQFLQSTYSPFPKEDISVKTYIAKAVH